MRRRIVRAAVAVALVTGTSIAFAFSTGPPASRTGAIPVGGKAAENLCTVCHSGSPVNDGNGLVEILGVPEVFVAGGTYPITVRLSYNHQPTDVPKWGFQLQAVSSATGDSAGLFTFPANLEQVPGLPTSVFKNRRYVEHGGDTSSVYFGRLGPVEWSVQWTAPVEDSTRIYFFVAGNAANGDGCSFCGGDHIYTDIESTHVAVATGVVPPATPYRYRTLLGPPNPNPFNQCVDLSFELARAGQTDLSIYDVTGRRIRTIYHDWHDVGPGANFWNGKRDDGVQAANGVYFIRLSAPGEKKPAVQKVTLAR